MDKSTVLKTFLEKGYQIDSETLNFFSKDDVAFKKFLLEMETKKLPSTITKEVVDTLLQNDLEIFEAKLEKKPITAEDISKILLDRFSIIKKILITHLDLVNLISISKINQKTKRFSLIGVVTYVDPQSDLVIIADDTGETNLHVDKKSLDEISVNDVLGFVCEINDSIYVKTVVFPDVPLRRNTKTLTEEKSAVFVNKITEDVINWINKQKMQVYLFTFTHPEILNDVSEQTKIVFVGEGPTFVTLLKMFSLFLFEGSFLKNVLLNKKIDDFLITLFKKRYFNSTLTFDKYLINNAFVLGDVPDIIVINGLNEAIQTNYKGTTLLTVDENTSWIINLKTREIIKLSFA